MVRKVTRLPTAAKRRVRNPVALESEGNVVVASMVSRLDSAPERILHQAGQAGLTEAVVLGFDADGEFYFASSKANGADVLWLLEQAKRRLLEYGD